jgi:hypothetical protein
MVKAKNLWATISIDANAIETLKLLRKIRQDLIEFAQLGRHPSLTSHGVHLFPAIESRIVRDELRESVAFEFLRVFDASAFKHFIHRLEFSVRTHEIVSK